MMWILWLILSALMLFIGMCYLSYRVAFYAPDKKQNDIHNILTGEQYDGYREEMLAGIDWLWSQPHENIRMPSRDGLQLTGRYYHRADSAPLVICFHGYRGNIMRDFCGVASVLLRSGYNVLLVNERAHMDSEGHTITFGIKERYDCQDWVQYAVSRFGSQVSIMLCGISMGAATVLMASGLELPSNVRGIVADCPYSSPKEIIQKVCKAMKLPVHITYFFLVTGAFLFGHFRLNEITATDAVRKANVPILIFHGEDDRFVPGKMSEDIQLVNPHIQRYTFPGAGHGMSYMSDKERYERILEQFEQAIFYPQD